MVSLDDFLSEELDFYVKELIVRALMDGVRGNKHKDEIIFNRYSLTILFDEKSITIHDDSMSDEKPLTLNSYYFTYAIAMQHVKRHD
jgi:hypothetical protein